jgi:hypothetical protein
LSSINKGGVLLTKKEILKQLKNENVYMGKDPNRTFAFYEERGLLPQSREYRKSKPLYPDNTPWILKEILFAHQVEKMTIEEIRRQQQSGSLFDPDILESFGLDALPLNFYYKTLYHGKYQSKNSDILVAIYETEIIFFLVEGLRSNRQEHLKILQKKILTVEEYGEFVKHRAVGSIIGEGRILEETHLLDALFG